MSNFEEIERTLSRKAARHLRKFRSDVDSRFPGKISKVVLFGSRARGDARLNAARNGRMIADYDMVRGADGLDAQETTKQARKFVDVCTKKWDLHTWDLHTNALDEFDDD
jgi:hypothetical protein